MPRIHSVVSTVIVTGRIAVFEEHNASMDN